jgi:hypothetical protein
MAKKKSALSQQEKRVAASALFTKPLTDRQRRELQQLAKLPDSQIDFSDAPEAKVRLSDVEVGGGARLVSGAGEEVPDVYERGAPPGNAGEPARAVRAEQARCQLIGKRVIGRQDGS